MATEPVDTEYVWALEVIALEAVTGHSPSRDEHQEAARIVREQSDDGPRTPEGEW